MEMLLRSLSQSLFVVSRIVKKELQQVRQDKRMLAVSIMAPILQVFLLGYAATTDVKSINVLVCDMDNSTASRSLVQRIFSTGYFAHRYSSERMSDIDSYIEDGSVALALIVPKGFGAKLLSRQTAPLSAVVDGSDASTANISLGYLTQIVASFSQGVALESIRPVGGQGIPKVQPEPRVWFNPDLKSSNYMVPGVVAMVLMIITMTLTALGIVKEREVGTLEQLMVSPIKSHELILGKLIPFVFIGFIDVVVVLAIARLWFEVPLIGNLWLLFALSGLFILTTLGLGLFISTIARSQQQAMLIAQFFFFMPFMFLSGFAFPISNMPVVIQCVTYLIPLRYFLEIVRGIFLKGANLSDLWIQTSALAVFGVAILSLSVIRFQKKLG